VFWSVRLTLGALLAGSPRWEGNIAVIWQPWEFVIIGGTALGTFIVANPWKVVLD